MAGTITALVAQRKNKDRVNVYLDGEFAFGLALIEALKLKRGQVLSDADIERLRGADDIEKAHEKALRFWPTGRAANGKCARTWRKPSSTATPSIGWWSA